jgi:hypothetical protein
MSTERTSVKIKRAWDTGQPNFAIDYLCLELDYLEDRIKLQHEMLLEALNFIKEDRSVRLNEAKALAKLSCP